MVIGIVGADVKKRIPPPSCSIEQAYPNTGWRRARIPLEVSQLIQGHQLALIIETGPCKGAGALFRHDLQLTDSGEVITMGVDPAHRAVRVGHHGSPISWLSLPPRDLDTRDLDKG